MLKIKKKIAQVLYSPNPSMGWYGGGCYEKETKTK